MHCARIDNANDIVNYAFLHLSKHFVQICFNIKFWSMNRENQPLVTDEPIEVQTLKKITNPLKTNL